ncbi:hypothetical protein F2P56_012069 [Juglans regia]|uniref:DUF4283 domain-containing protein n=2 Tax=Juglans regia TaxID=51240 RepID=A0A833XLF5_JUGRE|nr:uncharacterized protein LOC108996770 [Juglans regia]KAF5467857.1 hypothetical protein F2P56_012069 [Juglans regia]
MAAVEPPLGSSASGRPHSFAELVSHTPTQLPEVVVPIRAPKLIDGLTCVIFTREEIEKLAQCFCFSLVMKFLLQRPFLDEIRAFIRNRWGLDKQPIVSSMRRARNMFLRFSNEGDFFKAFSRENNEVDGKYYRIFSWNPDFSEENEPSTVPVWVTLPGLPPNLYHESFLRSLALPFGKYIQRYNSMRCASRTDGARICVEMDAVVDPIPGFWIGDPRQPSSRYQEIIYENLQAYCAHCHI